MRDDVYQHVCTLVLGFATLFRYAGYDMATFIVESVLYSAHLRDSSSIVSHAGFYGQAVREISMCVTSLMVPMFFHYLGPKKALGLGALLLCCFSASFFYIDNVLFFSVNFFTGLARSLTYIGLPIYQMQFSTKETLARNSARVSAIAGASLTIGATLYVFISGAEADVVDGNQSSEYRYYSEEETRFMYGAFTLLLLISFVAHCFLPNRQIKNSVESQNPHVKQSASKQAKAIISTMFDHSMLKLLPVLVNHAIFLVFAMSIYPTSLQFSSVLSKDYPQLTAYYAYTMFTGTIACSLVVDPLAKFFRDFSLRPLYFLSLSLELVMIILCWLTVPDWSTAQPTDDSALMPPNLIFVVIISFLCGLIDSMITAANTVYCSRIMPGRASHTYAAARFYIGTSAAILFFVSPSLSMTYHAIIQIVFIILAVFGFASAAKHIDELEAESSTDMDKQNKNKAEVVALTSPEVGRDETKKEEQIKCEEK
ncbi:hypothetical protein PRIPAC_79337 [Pristionchus pacificus]|nr:hypothetical protein PRIPAC_79337 [Pristionchus pacificus]